LTKRLSFVIVVVQTMKNKNTKTDHRPFHLHVEYFFRRQYCVYIVLMLMVVAAIKSEGRLVGAVREAYAQGFGIVGQFMREETTRMPVTFDIAARIPTTSSK
jgi:hypothetical protein